MRILNQSERNQPFVSIWNTTMKTATALIATFCLAATFSTSARADFSSADTKHGSTRLHSSVTAIDYGKFTWLAPEASVNHIVVSLADQTLYAYNGPQLVAYSNISSGKPGHETPTGAFTVSEKDVDHHSSIYDNASMPFFMRLTDGGVGLHAGFIPGYPASHGCVRLPYGMARELYQHVESGTPVEIIGSSVNPIVAQNAAAPATVHLAQN
jgi:lipoprotein-anchoring transpeptidase ErfK/SrfK